MGVEAWASTLLLLALLSFVLLLVMNLRVGLVSFWGKPVKSAKTSAVKEAPFWMCASPLALAALGLSFGFFPGPFESTLAPALAGSIYPSPLSVDVKLWFGWNAKALLGLSLSLMSLMIGLFLLKRFKLWKQWYRAVLDQVWDAADVFEAFLKRNQMQLEKLSDRFAERSRSTYLIAFFSFLFVMIAWRGSDLGLGHQRLLFNSSPFILMIGLASTLAAAIAMSHRSLVSVALVLGVLGASVGLIFAYYGAVDLALTQVLVELLMAVVFALMISKAKDLPPIHKEKRIYLRLLLSMAVGALFFWMSSMAPTNYDSFETARFYQENAFAQAQGANTVNVILVDFRALDTLNEALVVLVAALGISALLSKWKAAE
jgi:multicomponent Na+:H+ antiporter subunit A